MSTPARVFMPDNTLARGIDAPGGATFGDLVLNATRRVEALGPSVNAFVEERSIALLQSLADAPPTTHEDRQALAMEAALLAEVAGPGRRDGIGDLAKGIALLIRHMNAQGVWRADIVHVHAATLALATGRRPVPDLTEMLSGLRHARASIDLYE